MVVKGEAERAVAAVDGAVLVVESVVDDAVPLAAFSGRSNSFAVLAGLLFPVVAAASDVPCSACRPVSVVVADTSDRLCYPLRAELPDAGSGPLHDQVDWEVARAGAAGCSPDGRSRERSLGIDWWRRG